MEQRDKEFQEKVIERIPDKDKKKESSDWPAAVYWTLALVGVVLVILPANTDFSYWPSVIYWVVFLFTALLKSGYKQQEDLKEKGIDTNNLILSGKYLHGHWNMDKPVEPTCLELKDDHVNILVNWTYAQLGSVSYADIVNVSVEDKTTVSRRVGLKRMAVVGLFAFAMKKKVTDDLAYLVIEAKHKGRDRDIYFEFSKKEAFNEANLVKNKILGKIPAAVDDQPSEEPPKAAQPKDASLQSQIKELFEMKEKGMITEEEYSQAKGKLIGGA